MKKSKFFFNFFYFLKLDFIKKLNKHWYPTYEFNTTRVEQKSNFQYFK